MSKELPYQRRDEFDQELYLRPIDADGRRFLQIMFQSANGTAPDGCEGGIVRRTQFWLLAEQAVLADLLGVRKDIKPESRTKAVRRIVEDLEGLGILARQTMSDVNEDGKPIERLYYVLCLISLMDLPEIDLKTPAGRVVAHLLSNDPFEARTAATALPVSPTRVPADAQSTSQPPLSPALSGGLSGRLSPALSGGLSGPSKIPAPVPVLEFNTILTPDQEHDAGGIEDFDSVFGQEKIPDRSFAEIDPDEVRWIAGFSPQSKTPTLDIRRRMFLGYFRDAVSRGFASVAEASQLLQVFSMCGHRMSVPSSPSVQKVRDPTDWIRTVWMNRKDRPPKPSPADRRITNELLACEPAATK